MVKIYVDIREKESEVPKYLTELGVLVIFKQLAVGDYVIAEDVVAERKTVSDLAKSVFDGRFFSQLSRLTRSADRCFLIVEGDLEKMKYITSNYKSVLAALYYSSIVDRVPVILTSDPKHTAEVLKYLSIKLYESPYALRTTTVSKNKPRDAPLSEWQLYVVSALPGVGIKTAERLLRKFGSVKRVFNASIAELASTEGLSEEKANLIFRVINEPYVKKVTRDLKVFTEKSKNSNDSSSSSQ
ncbi:MAG: ERCC4 domain-containing protein [Sulfolobales archaeon]